MFKNYVCVSFYSDKAGKDKNLIIHGCCLIEIFGKTSLQKVAEKLAELITKENENCTISPDDITITDINEISRRLYKRLVK